MRPVNVSKSGKILVHLHGRSTMEQKKKKDPKAKSERLVFNPKTHRILTIVMWVGFFMPVMVIMGMIYSQPEEELPSVEMLENPPEMLASIIYADDGQTELGRYWSVNRTTVSYKEISPYVFDALIATEDERYMEHSGVDFPGLARAVLKMGEAGGGSTITQQLAKLLFTLQERERIAKLRLEGHDIPEGKTGIWKRLDEKVKENIIAVRLEERYTKEEIITMYLNQFDFLYNAVGIENAAKVYFNKKPSELNKLEAATLVGMCKNPSLYNPYTHMIKDYRSNASTIYNVPINSVSDAQIQELREKDSTRAITRRNQVLMQWLRNSEDGNGANEALKNYVTQAEVDSLKLKPIVIDYQVVDHKEGLAPYFRETLRSEITALFEKKDKNGEYLYHKKNGEPYDIYKDGLKIYTTINVNLQQYAEQALTRHLREDLQIQFDKNNSTVKRFPFADDRDVTDEQVASMMSRARKNSARYAALKEQGISVNEIERNFDLPVPMRIFAWTGEIDTLMTPNDSIRYYKGLLRAGLLSIDPGTGFIKAWVGGPEFKHFAFDHVKQSKRQVGSTIKPFVYSTAMAMGVVKPCTIFEDMPYCVDLGGPGGQPSGKWCPSGDIPVGKSVEWALAQSNNPGTVAVMSKMGGYAGPKTIAKILRGMKINMREADEVPSMCLGSMDMSLFEMVGAQAMFVNQGIYIQPTSILRIEDRNGNVIFQADPYTKEVLNSSVAFRTLKMMEGVVSGGTATSLRGGGKWGGLKAPMAGKTGTTQRNSDGWFMGLTPDLVTGVWVGAEDRHVHFRSMLWGQGARMALPIYGYYMQKVYADPKLKISTAEFEPPINYQPELFECDGDGDNGIGDIFGLGDI